MKPWTREEEVARILWEEGAFFATREHRVETAKTIVGALVDTDFDDRLDDLTEALHRIAAWAEAYPIDVFPEPDWEKARELLKAGGITIDAVVAHVARHVVEGVGKIARDALAL